jgi:phosphoglycerate dehydrogenase-like enzyme
MELLIVEPLEPEVLRWISLRHSVRHAPQLARDPRAFRRALHGVRALVIPASVTLDAKTLRYAPHLQVVGRITAGAENIDLEACTRAGVELVRGCSATAQAEAEFMICALLTLLRRVPVIAADGLRLGRELGTCVVGLVGMAQAADKVVTPAGGVRCRCRGLRPFPARERPRLGALECAAPGPARVA